MPAFRTVLPPLQPDFSIRHSDEILSLGSCFAQHLGERLQQLLFRIEVNPFGILYNPASLSRGLQQLQSGYRFSEADIFQQADRWVSFYHHGAFTASEPGVLLDQINDRADWARERLAGASVLLLTLGTAFVFRHGERGEVVANCHKLPATAFRRYRLSVAEAVEVLWGALEPVLADHPGLRVLLTVSPVRHLRDGLVENQRSKATLLLAVEELVQRSERLHYFPAYELLLDDLRDYRFFAEDMAHPTPQAIDYVWDYFANAFFSEETKQLNHRIGQVRRAMAHRPLFPQSEEYRRFREQQRGRVEELAQAFPELEWGEMRAFFSD